MTWLSKIEDYPRIQDIKHLARVIRELAEHINYLDPKANTIPMLSSDALEIVKEVLDGA